MIKLTPKQQELFDTMSDISEECCCAGWYMGNEYIIWSAILTGDLGYGISQIDPAKLEKCRGIADELDGWIVWLDDDDDPELPNEEWGPIFMSMADWLQKFEGLLSQAQDNKSE